MHNQPLRQASPLSGNNQAYLEQYLEVYLTDRQQLEASWQQLFDQLFTESQPLLADDPLPSTAQSYALSQTKQSNLVGISYSFHQLLPLIQAFRSEGHRQAQLDPLNRYPIQPWPVLQLGFYSQLTDPTAIVEIEPLQALQPIRTLNELYTWLQQTYCGTIGIEYMHLSDGEQRAWLQKRFEVTPISPLNSESRAWLYQQLTAAESLERYLAAQFPGAKRFSLEGSEVTIPLLNYLIQLANQQAMERVVLGMSHRGRLNALVNVMGKPPRDLFAAFAGTMDDHQIGSGDVKYHQGFYSTLTTDKGPLALSLLFNPSHLEIINPVVMGATRAYQDQQADLQSKRVLAITLHGDSAFAGQGVVQETFNYSQLPGYSVGGSIRIIINNQLGFTTGESQARSSYYCSDIAKSFEVPIFHVNGDDPEAVLRVAQIAFEFRNTFERDVVIDLVSYRRHGHNEADEPSATQPLLYHCIKQQPTVRSRYAQQLIKAAELNAPEAEQQVKQMRQRLQQGDPLVAATPAKFCTTQANLETPEAAVDTRCKLQTLQKLGRQLAQYPKGMLLHPRVAKIYQDRIRMIEGQQPFDWGGAEMLAYASLLAQKIPVRLSGQDSQRGTFFHRHAVLHHQQQDQYYIPLAHLHPGQGRFQIWDSTLSEAAVLAFEYGYALMTPKALVIWEAQFGDFANGAQVVFDQFISASEQKWGERCGITLLLPHGYEGQGPEHSSARLERHLQLCAEQNIQVCLPSHAGQIYHLLRQQGLKTDARPLIILSPKSLLRHPLATARLVELAEGAWQPVIIDSVLPKQAIKRIVFCSGKVYYDLLEKSQKQSNQQILLVRIEQLYPFPQQQIHQLLDQHKQLRSVIWCQEEPRNQGAWSFMQAHLAPLITQINPKLTLQYVGRSEAAAPSVGALSRHQQQQQQLVTMALNDSDH